MRSNSQENLNKQLAGGFSLFFLLRSGEHCICFLALWNKQVCVYFIIVITFETSGGIKNKSKINPIIIHYFSHNTQSFTDRKITWIWMQRQGYIHNCKYLKYFPGFESLSAWKTYPIPEIKYTVTKHNYFSEILVKLTPCCSGRCWKPRPTGMAWHLSHLRLHRDLQSWWHVSVQKD